MTVLIEFKDLLGAPNLVLFGLAGSAAVSTWQCAPEEQTILDQLDQVPWGHRPADAPEAVRKVGELIRTKLAGVPPIKKALIDTFALGGMAPRPLYFRVSSSDVEAVPFEAVWDDHIESFACLDPRWPIARLPADAAEPAGPFTMERRVRLVAILAAEGVDPAGQLNALRDARNAQSGLAVEVLVLTSSPALVTEINDTQDPTWKAELVPATADALVDRLREIQPHLLHIFCHGTAAGPRLLIAQREDLAVLELSATHFETVAQPAFLAPWLVTLNCCEGAAPGDQMGSLASALVRAGMPAVLGMRKAVDVAMAHGFCADLYKAVFARLAEIAPGGRAVSDLDWASLLHKPRRSLATVHGALDEVAGRQKEWTMPVLYLATTNPQLRGMPTADLDDAAVHEELVTLGTADSLQAHGNLPPAQAAALRDQALAVLYPQG